MYHHITRSAASVYVQFPACFVLYPTCSRLTTLSMITSNLRHAIVSGLTVALATTSTIGAYALPELRIMPLGDSITKGSMSTDENGYRKILRDTLLSNRNGSAAPAVDMIGSLRYGDMEDNDHEGHSGKYLADIKAGLENSIQARPNVILLMGGTNNMDKEVDLDGAPGLMTDIIDALFHAAPDATVLVAPITWANDARMQKHTDKFNKALKDIIDVKGHAGSHILSVPIDLGKSDLTDKKHPNDVGYAKMAKAWYQAILEVDDRKWLAKPVHVDAKDVPCTGLGYGSDRVSCGDEESSNMIEDDDKSAAIRTQGRGWLVASVVLLATWVVPSCSIII